MKTFNDARRGERHPEFHCATHRVTPIEHRTVRTPEPTAFFTAGAIALIVMAFAVGFFGYSVIARLFS